MLVDTIIVGNADFGRIEKIPLMPASEIGLHIAAYGLSSAL